MDEQVPTVIDDKAKGNSLALMQTETTVALAVREYRGPLSMATEAELYGVPTPNGEDADEVLRALAAQARTRTAPDALSKLERIRDDMERSADPQVVLDQNAQALAAMIEQGLVTIDFVRGFLGEAFRKSEASRAPIREEEPWSDEKRLEMEKKLKLKPGFVHRPGTDVSVYFRQPENLSLHEAADEVMIAIERVRDGGVNLHYFEDKNFDGMAKHILTILGERGIVVRYHKEMFLLGDRRLSQGEMDSVVHRMACEFEVKYKREPVNIDDQLVREVRNSILRRSRMLNEWEPPSAGKVLSATEATNDPVAAFARDCLVFEVGTFTTTDDLVTAWRRFCLETETDPGSRHVFLCKLNDVAAKRIRREKKRLGGKRVPGYVGVGLR